MQHEPVLELEAICPMKKITPHLTLLDSVRICNVWLLEHGDQRILIDTGFGTERWFLDRALASANIRSRGDLTAVILTHRHTDHAGSAAWLRKKFDAPVICHRHDEPFLTGTAKPPALRRGIGTFYEELLCVIEDRWPARCEIDEVFDDGIWKWGFRIIPTFGHTEGSVMLYHEPTKTLFSGDSILTGIPPFRSLERLHLAVPSFSNDYQSCRESVRRFLKERLPIDTLCSGHGPAVTLEVSKKLQQFTSG